MAICAWDDWGGWHDNYRTTPFPDLSSLNPYGPKPSDPNEWGFRVPLIVISPWLVKRGYISSGTRSQGAILNFVEDAFGFGAGFLHGDDAANSSDDLGDMFDFTRASPGLTWMPLPSSFVPTYALPQNQTCPQA